MSQRLTVNRQSHQVQAEQDTPLLWVLRGELQLTGTKFGCGIGQCGACTVQLGDTAVRSCSLPVQAVGDNAVTTIEGLQGPVIDALRAAWTELDVVQCGYCQSGQLVSAAALLARSPRPSEDEIHAALDNHLCRCGTTPRIALAVRRAVTLLAGRAAAVQPAAAPAPSPARARPARAAAAETPATPEPGTPGG